VSGVATRISKYGALLTSPICGLGWNEILMMTNNKKKAMQRRSATKPPSQMCGFRHRLSMCAALIFHSYGQETLYIAAMSIGDPNIVWTVGDAG
jgi:hypothetical protein